MPLRVPDSNIAPITGSKPTETDLLMALAVMHEHGRIPTFDERFRGEAPFSQRLEATGVAPSENVEDRREEVNDPGSLAARELIAKVDDILGTGPKLPKYGGSRTGLSRDLGLGDIGRPRGRKR